LRLLLFLKLFPVFMRRTACCLLHCFTAICIYWQIHVPSLLQIIVVMALLIRVLTVWPALAGLGVTIAIIPTTMLLGKLLTSALASFLRPSAALRLLTSLLVCRCTA
jgi:hypothetical protein